MAVTNGFDTLNVAMDTTAIPVTFPNTTKSVTIRAVGGEVGIIPSQSADIFPIPQGQTFTIENTDLRADSFLFIGDNGVTASLFYELEVIP